MTRIGEQVAARNVDVVGEDQGHRIPGDRDGQRLVERDDVLDDRAASRGQRERFGAAEKHSRLEPAGVTAEVGSGAGPHHELHRKAERQGVGLVGNLDFLERGEQRRAAVPAEVRAALDH